jgi:hypothetical protein
MWLIRRHPASSADLHMPLEARVQQHKHMLNYGKKSRCKKPIIRQVIVRLHGVPHVHMRQRSAARSAG